MRNLDLILYTTLLALGLTACDKGVEPDDSGGLKKIFSGSVLNMDLDYPYLYVAAWTDGLWRIDISKDDFPVQYLALLDSAKGIYEVDDVDAHGDDIIATTWTGIWRSEDGGDNWLRAEQGIDDVYPTYSISRSPHNPDWIITHIPPMRVYRSEDNGHSWHFYDTGIINSATWFIEWNPYQNGEVWISGSTNMDFPRFYCIENYGAKVKLEVDLNLFGNSDLGIVGGIVFDPNDGNIVYIGTTIIPYPIKSMDGGYTWQVISSDSIWILSLIKDARYSNIFYIASFKDIHISTDTLQTFELIAELSAEDEGTIGLLVHDLVKNRLFAATGDNVFVLSLTE